MPSYTFVSTANAFVLRGAVPVFVDIRPDTLNLDETAIEAAITPRTRAIVPVHYAGVSCEMDAILSIAERHGVTVVEDAAQGLMASYRGRPLGTLGVLGAYSFHESKNVVAGEGGALLINDDAYFARAEIIREKGTDRTRFFRGEIDKYTWRDIGSSYLPGEVTAAFLLAQLEGADEITRIRRSLWDRYHLSLADAESEGRLRRPVIPGECEHNGHMYYVLVRARETRDRILRHLRSSGVDSVFHYIPLHSSPAGQRLCRAVGELPVTTRVSGCLLRLPLWAGMADEQVDRVVQCLLDAPSV